MGNEMIVKDSKWLRYISDKLSNILFKARYKVTYCMRIGRILRVSRSPGEPNAKTDFGIQTADDLCRSVAMIGNTWKFHPWIYCWVFSAAEVPDQHHVTMHSR